ncbi:MAG: hypothetical protein WEE89_02830 [Gemmatimonadota bacterium]
MGSPNARETELRAKYLDWCSARLADHFLALSPDEIYEMAERASHGREPETDAVVAIGASSSSELQWQRDAATVRIPDAWRENQTFRVLVARVTEVLADTLPSFEEWSAAYAAEPDRYDDELLGFWKEKL